MTLDQKGREFIQSLEGLRLNAYLDGAGVPTIGYGTTIYPSGERVKMGNTTTKLHAENYFSHDLIKFEIAVTGHIIVDWITQNQFNALVSLTYNIGISAFGGSTIKKLVLSPNRNNKEVITPAFLAWNKIRKNGVLIPSEGLTNRRKKEVELYFS